MRKIRGLRSCLVVVSAALVLAACSTGKTPVTPSTATSTTAVAPVSDTAVWPWATSGRVFTSPKAAAESFAKEYLGFSSPVLEAFQQGDARSGEVPIRPRLGGPVTTVFLRQLDRSFHWSVLGAASSQIELSSPSALELVSSPVALRGMSTAFEASVNVSVLADGSFKPIGEGTVMGGSMGVMGPFTGEVSFSTPMMKSGAIMLRVLSAKDGSTEAAGVLRVHFSH